MLLSSERLTMGFAPRVETRDEAKVLKFYSVYEWSRVKELVLKRQRQDTPSH